MKLQRAILFLGVFVTVLPAANLALAQEYVKRLQTPARVRGFIGGESHDSYVIRVRKGQLMIVQISWRREHDNELGNNHAEFWVAELPNDGDAIVKFGKESDKGKHWSGKIPRTGDYYIYVVAHPTAHYTLRVRLK